MTAPRPNKLWWTVSAISDAKLPDMPAGMTGIDAMIKRCDWREHPEFSRKRSGRGGGWEYSWELFPLAARRKLLKESDFQAKNEPPAAADFAQMHAYYDSLPTAVKGKAEVRLKTLQMVMDLERTDGVTRFFAVERVALFEDVSERTIWNWFKMVAGADRSDWLYCLAPRHRAATRTDKQADCSPEFFEYLKTVYLQLEGPTFASAHRACAKIAKAKGWVTLADRTARRRLNELVPRVSQVFMREGYEGLARCFPPQTRDRTQMSALEGVNADCHKFDVFVTWPDEEKPTRAQIVAFQDLYSGKILSWRIDHSPNKVAVMAAFGDLVDTYGIPEHCLFDNGREFANKWMTAGAKTRFRFKVRDDDPAGVLTLLGIKIHWAKPGHGQAKPIERAFRDFASDIAKDPRFAGAYVGNRPDAKPENYGKNAIPIEEFIAVVAEGVEEHNARLGRRSPTALGRSFDETFAASYARQPRRMPSDEQRRLWMMGQEVLKLHRSHGRLTLHKNTYWSEWMNEHVGERIVARFNPEDLHSGVYIYDTNGAFLGYAACEEKVGFFDLAGAKDHARRDGAIKRTQRKLRDQLRPIPLSEVAETMAEDRTLSEAAQSKIVQANFTKRPVQVEAPIYVEPENPAETARVLEFQASFDAEQARKRAQVDTDTALDRFQRALEVERRSEAGDRIGEAEMRWLLGYQETPEYRGQAKMHEDFKDGMFLK